METAQVSTGSIVVGIDGSPWSDGALEWAIDQAALEQRSLTIVHAIPSVAAQSMGMYASSGLDFVRLLDDAHADAQTLLTTAVSHARDRKPELNVHDVLSVSDPRSILLDLSEHAAMVVVGSRGRGPVASLVLGSVSLSVSKHAVCPVVVLRPVSHQLGHGILVGVDGMEGSVSTTEFAYRMASFRGLPLTVLHCYQSTQSVAVPVPGAPEPDLSAERVLVSETLAGMGEKFPDVAVTVRLVAGPADRQLIAQSPGYDLAVVGHHRTTPLVEIVYDSVAPAVIEHAQGPVAVIPCRPISAQPDVD
jgi:nucleotide-binding universal stress UspA family protein